MGAGALEAGHSALTPRAVRFQPEAIAELEDAHAWYEGRRPGLGFEFAGCVEAVIEAASRNPELYPFVHGDVRRGITRRFPYSVLYAVRDDVIVVVAVYHTSRDPVQRLTRS